jgi:hypothetical protein
MFWYLHLTVMVRTAEFDACGLVPTSSSFLFSQIYRLLYVLLSICVPSSIKTHIPFQVKEKLKQ